VTHLADTSVMNRAGKAAVAARLQALEPPSICAVIALELGHSARNRAEHDTLMESLRGFPWVPITEASWATAMRTQAALTDRAQHRGIRIPELLVAAVAQEHDLTVLHYDRDFDRIAEVTGQPVEWVVPAGTAD
jgi:predicted nucleic acid-binding protein